MSTAPRTNVWTDGSCLKNPGGAIGWAWAREDGTHDSGRHDTGTNQIAELLAVFQAILAHPGPATLVIHSDSQYAINCSRTDGWVVGWRKKGWRTSSGPVKNLPLVKAIADALADRTGDVEFVWVKGHNGNPMNEKADRLAGDAARATAKVAAR